MLGTYLRLGAAVAGVAAGVIGISTGAKEEENKDAIIEELAEKYNELVESINNGTFDTDSLDDVEFDEEGSDEDDDSAYQVPETDDEEELEYYPSKVIPICSCILNRVQNLYTDIEKCNNDTITFEEDALLDEVSAAVSMLATAYQTKYIDGMSVYNALLLSKISDIKKIRNYDSTIKDNKRFLCKDIEDLISATSQLNTKLQLHREELKNSAEYSDEDNDFVIPVYHKKGDT